MALLPGDGSSSRAVSQSNTALERASILLGSVFVSSSPLKNSPSWTNGALPFVMKIIYVLIRLPTITAIYDNFRYAGNVAQLLICK